MRYHIALWPFVLLLLFSGRPAGGECKNGCKRKGAICWNAGDKLRWKDFKGEVPRKTEYGAITSVKIDYEILSRSQVRVCNYMLKEDSWVMEGVNLDETLEHEQYHFDLAEVYARRIRQEMAGIPEPSIKHVEGVMNKWVEEHNKAQDFYDEESQHSQNIDQQMEWQQRIDGELKELEAFADPVVTLTGP